MKCLAGWLTLPLLWGSLRAHLLGLDDRAYFWPLLRPRWPICSHSLAACLTVSWRDSDPETVWLIISHYQARPFCLPVFRLGGKVAKIPAARIRGSTLTSDLHLMCVAWNTLTPSRGPINTSLLKHKLFWRAEIITKWHRRMDSIVRWEGKGQPGGGLS